MAYTNAIFYIDFENGSDAARTPLTGVIASDNGSGGVRLNFAGHGLSTGAIVITSLFTTYINGTWKITKIDDDNFDLDTLSWQVTADTSGTVTPHGGGAFNDAWKTLTFGATAARTAPGDEFRIAKTPDPTSLGQNATWHCVTNYDSGDTGDFQLPTNSSTNTSPIVITRAAHGYATGDFVIIRSHTKNTNANGFWQITKVNDDSFSLDNSVGNDVGSGGYIKKQNHKVVELTTAVTQLIDNCDKVWTGNTGVTASVDNTQFKSSAYSMKAVTGASFGSNKIITQYGLAASLNLSGYQQISFWLRSSVALAAGSLEIRLYSDTACTSLVETFAIPAIPIVNLWYPVVINKGSALSATVQGIALYCTATAMNSRTFNLDNINACKDATAADSLTLQSLIAKNVENKYGDHVFCGLQSIIGKWLIYDNDPKTLPYQGMGYYGVSETVEIFKRETVKFYPTATNTVLNNMVENGTEAKHYSLSGGWNKTTYLKDGLTVLDGLCGAGIGLGTGVTYHEFDNLHFARFDQGIRWSYMYNRFTNIYFTNNNFGFNEGSSGAVSESMDSVVFLLNAYSLWLNQSASAITITNVIINGSIAYGMGIGNILTISGMVEFNNNKTAIYAQRYAKTWGTIDSLCFNGTGIYFANINNVVIAEITKFNNNNKALDTTNTAFKVKFEIIGEACNNYYLLYCTATTTGYDFVHIEKLNANYYIAYSNAYISSDVKFKRVDECIGNINISLGVNDMFMYNVDFVNDPKLPQMLATGVKVYFVNCTGLLNVFNYDSGNYDESRAFYHAFDNEPNNHQIKFNGGYTISDEVERHTASGISWKTVIDLVWRTIDFPYVLGVSKVAVTAGDTLLISVWLKKSHATNIGAIFGIRSYKHQGIAADQIVTAGERTDWHLVTIQVTCTVTEVIELDYEIFYTGGLDEAVWIDDITVTKI